MSKFKWSSLIYSKKSGKRILKIYLPAFLGFYLFLFAISYIAFKPVKYIQDLNVLYENNIPIVYHDRYNIEFFGLEEFHPFDTKKYGRIYNNFNQLKNIDTSIFIHAAQPTKDTLLTHHSEEYLDSLESSWKLARITELGFLRFFPNKLSKNLILEPMLYQSGGSLMAARAALHHGWAINLGGGFHHASAENGEGFCAIADISLIVKNLQKSELIKTAMIIDLDAHQGNGHGEDFKYDNSVYIFDIYNKEVYPRAHDLKEAINTKIELQSFTDDKLYLSKLNAAIQKSFNEFTPDIIIYAAGTDILEGDPLGGLSVSAEGIIKRDEIVFDMAHKKNIPIVMLLSGGYQKSNADIITNSILNLKEKYDLF